jgi:hypothetical protein
MQNRHSLHRGLVSVQPLERRQLLSGTASISGAAYDDVNHNAVHEAGEAGLKNVRIYLDYDNDGAWDKGKEPTTLTDKRGSFSFNGLGAGTYRLRQVVPEKMAAVGPRSGWFKVTLAEGQQVTRRLFANAQVSASTGAVGDNDVLVHYTYSGDTDFNGKVNLDDYSRVDDAFNNHSSGFMNGDFDSNGIVNFQDYTLIDLAFNSQNGTLGRALSFLDGSGAGSGSDPALQKVQQHLQQFGDSYKNTFLATAAKPAAQDDVAATKKDGSLANAVKYLTGENKHVHRTSTVQAVMDHYHQLGADYKRAFLKLAKNA